MNPGFLKMMANRLREFTDTEMGVSPTGMQGRRIRDLRDSVVELSEQVAELQEKFIEHVNDNGRHR